MSADIGWNSAEEYRTRFFPLLLPSSINLQRQSSVYHEMKTSIVHSPCLWSHSTLVTLERHADYSVATSFVHSAGNRPK